MSAGQRDPAAMDAGGGSGGARGPAGEEELRAAYEAELKRVRVEHVLLEHVVTMINLGMRRTGLAPGTEDERDPAQVRLAIESIRALMPLLEQTAPQEIGQIRAALSQLQLAFVRVGGQQPAAAGAGSGPAPERSEAPSPEAPSHEGPSQEAPDPGAPGPAQRSGRLWIPGQ
jgi:hypothetical protein